MSTTTTLPSGTKPDGPTDADVTAASASAATARRRRRADARAEVGEGGHGGEDRQTWPTSFGDGCGLPGRERSVCAGDGRKEFPGREHAADWLAGLGLRSGMQEEGGG